MAEFQWKTPGSHRLVEDAEFSSSHQREKPKALLEGEKADTPLHPLGTPSTVKADLSASAGNKEHYQQSTGEWRRSKGDLKAGVALKKDKAKSRQEQRRELRRERQHSNKRIEEKYWKTGEER